MPGNWKIENQLLDSPRAERSFSGSSPFQMKRLDPGSDFDSLTGHAVSLTRV